MTPDCHYCGEGRGVESDHIVPKSLGGPNASWNRVPTCGPCNIRKAASWPTCLCPMCTAAVLQFIATPRLVVRALQELAVRMDAAHVAAENYEIQRAKAADRAEKLADLVEWMEHEISVNEVSKGETA